MTEVFKLRYGGAMGPKDWLHALEKFRQKPYLDTSQWKVFSSKGLSL